jgi:3-polyprenyl-4-hydroxybenzoate decarboxylase
MQKQRLIIGVSGSSAPQLAWTTLQALHGHSDIESHLVISRGADKTIQLPLAWRWCPARWKPWPQ